MRDALGASQERFAELPWGARVRWAPPENLHLTLRFLGETLPQQIDPLLRALDAILAPVRSFECNLERIAFFPSTRRARILAATFPESERAEPDDGRRLTDLAARAESAAVAAGFAPDARRFRAHLTLGRVRKPPLSGVVLDASVDAPPLPVDAAVLYRSQLTPEGARYTELGRVALAAGQVRSKTAR